VADLGHSGRSACDLHLHSSASGHNDEWYSIEFGCPESYAEPRAQYELCKARGMSLVTLTDHDTIAGGLELLDRPDFFLSEEVSTMFPEDGSGIHVLAWNITPKQHDLIQAARKDVYRLVELLRSEAIVHACAHPLYSPNAKLSVATLEKIFALFPIIEGINGLTDRGLERDLTDLVASLDARTISEMAARHDIHVSDPGRRIVMTAGSDDHVQRHCASCFTSVDHADLAPRAFIEAVAAGEARCHGHQADLDVMCLTAGRVTYSFLEARKQENPSYRDPFVDLIDVVAGRRTNSEPADDLVRSFLSAAQRTSTPLGRDLDPGALENYGDIANDRVMTGIRRVHDGLIERGFSELVDGINDLDMYRVIGAIRDLAGAITTAAPYLFAADHFAKQRGDARDVLATWNASPLPPRPDRLAIFSDTVGHVDGVSMSLRRFVTQTRGEVRIPYCGERPPEATDAYLPLACAASHATGLYGGLELHMPSPLGTIDWLWRNDITRVELATPGPMGIVGLLAARLMRLPVTASYHTELCGLTRVLSSNHLVHKSARWLSAWFYGAVDRVFAFSESSRRRLLELGVPAERIEHVPVAIDPQEFSPCFAHADSYRALGIEAGNERVVLTVGRLSREKNLPIIIEAIGRLQSTIRPVLVIVGDGPERAALERLCVDRPYVVFAGLQVGDHLKRLYATASAFVFASRIDTLGLATMEAMSSGVPVVVPSDAAIAELVVDGVSGSCYEFGVDGLVDALKRVLQSPARRAMLAANARQAMVDRWARRE
jgi:glycosyltransferase involved in cell wall biosynthesis